MRKIIWLKKLAIVALLLTALVLAASAQTQFETQTQENWDAALPALLGAMVLFSLAAFLAERIFGKPAETGSPALPANQWQSQPTDMATANAPALQSSWLTTFNLFRRRKPWRVLALSAASVLTLILLGQLRSEPPLPDYTLPFSLWIAAIGLYVLAVVSWPRLTWHDPRRWLRANWRMVLLIGTLTIAAGLLRLYDIVNIPPTLSGDEGTFGLESIKTIEGIITNPFSTGWMSVPTLTFFFNSIGIRLFGNTIFAVRLPWALVGIATIPIVFLLAKRLAGLRLGVLTAGLLAVYHYHIHFSRLGLNNAADPFFLALVLLFFYRACQRQRASDWAWCGVTLGVTQYFYFGARFAVVVVVVLIVFYLWRDGRTFWRCQRCGLAIMIGAAIVAAAPLIQFALRYPNEYNARPNAIGIYQSGWMELAKQVTGKTEAELLLDQFKRTALAYNAYLDRTSFYGSYRPLFDGWWAVLFVLGLGYATLRPLDRRLFPMLFWWWGAIILGGMLTEGPPSSQRLITTAVPAVFFVGLALVKIGQIGQRLWSNNPGEVKAHPLRGRGWPLVKARALGKKTMTLALTALAIIILGGFSFNRYFVEYTPLRTYGNWSAVTAMGFIKYAAQHFDDSWRIVFVGAPYMYVGFGSIHYLQPDLNATDLIDPVTAPLDPQMFPPGKKLAFIVLPQRKQELALLQQFYPGGQIDVVPSPAPGATDPLFTVYEVTPPGN